MTRKVLCFDCLDYKIKCTVKALSINTPLKNAVNMYEIKAFTGFQIQVHVYFILKCYQSKYTANSWYNQSHSIFEPCCYAMCLYFWNFLWGWEEAGQIKWSFVRGLDYLLGSWVTGILYFMLYSAMPEVYFYFNDVSITSLIQVGLLNP